MMRNWKRLVSVVAVVVVLVMMMTGTVTAQITEHKITSHDGVGVDFFGSSVSISGNSAIAGAYGNTSSGWRVGAAYIYDRGADGTWLETAKLIPSEGRNEDGFGGYVSIDGDSAIMGGHNFNKCDSVYVFERNGGAWTETGILRPVGAAGGSERPGRFLSVSGDDIIVAGQVSGSAYIFGRDSEGTWSQTAKLMPEDPAIYYVFGGPVSISGDYAMVGWKLDDDHGVNSGSVSQPSHSGMNPGIAFAK